MRSLFAPRIRRRLALGDSGFTLSELLVTMLALGILMTAVSALFLANLKSTETTSARLKETNQGRVAMESMSRLLRTAVLPSSLATCTSCGAQAAFIHENRVAAYFAFIQHKLFAFYLNGLEARNKRYFLFFCKVNIFSDISQQQVEHRRSLI